MVLAQPEKVYDPESQTSSHSEATVYDNKEAEAEVVAPGELSDPTANKEACFEVVWESHDDPRNPKVRAFPLTLNAVTHIPDFRILARPRNGICKCTWPRIAV